MLPLHQGIVYGPVRSRRLGQSLGINILPRHQKICTFNCSYCQYGWTRNYPSGATSSADAWPDPDVVALSVGAALERLKYHGEHVDRLTLAGHGEPTLHPQFPDVVDALLRVRDEVAPGLPLAILSNSSTLASPAVTAALERIDQRYMKLDAGDATLLRRVNAATVPFDQIVEGLRQLPHIVIQTMFVRDRLGRIDNAGDLAVSAWITTVSAIRPDAVHIYTIDRAPAWPYLQPIAATRLHDIARRAQAVGLTADAFAAPGEAAMPGCATERK
jgi:wyosine [tRNA(Phe)-imidazoG37] synthetase (radical SAM superfamily)